jgi:hypothetical protein
LNTTETNEIEIISSAIVSNNLGGKIVASSSTTS